MNVQYKQRVCTNGHQAEVIVPQESDTNQFCKECGEKLISECMNCNSIIHGYKSVSGFISVSADVPVPNYCFNCGKPYPWTVSTLEGMKEIIELSELNETEKSEFKKSIPDLLMDNPKTQLAAFKFKKYVPKVGTLAKNALHDLIIDIGSETAKKIISGL